MQMLMIFFVQFASYAFMRSTSKTSKISITASFMCHKMYQLHIRNCQQRQCAIIMQMCRLQLALCFTEYSWLEEHVATSVVR